MVTDTGRELGWNDEIENDGSDFVLLPAGEYPFRVTGFERARFAPKPGAKIPACPTAKLAIEIDGQTTLTHNLYLHTKCEGLLCQFFRAIGARKHGERIVMDWGKVVGASGHCVVDVRDWTGRAGETKQSNEIKKFLDPEDVATPQAATAGTADVDDIPF